MKYLSVLALAMALALPAHADLAEADAAWERDDDAVAAKEYRALAEQGNTRAQARLGYLLLNGAGVPQNAPEALRWIERSASQGDPEGQYRLGSMYWDGTQVKQDHRQAVTWWQKAVAQGHAAAMHTLGHAYRNGLGVSKDPKMALDLFRKAAAKGNRDGERSAAVMMFHGEAIPADVQSALAVWKKLADTGDELSQYLYGEAHLLPLGGLRQDFPVAAEYLQKAAAKGDQDAQLLLAQMYREGAGFPKDAEKARREFQRLAEAGIVRAQLDLAAMYADGKDIKRDPQQALRWFKLAAEKGDARAKFSIGALYWFENGLGRNETEAFKWFSQAVMGGYTEAIKGLALMYDEGVVLPVDCATLTGWMRQAAPNTELVLDEIQNGSCKEPKRWAEGKRLGGKANELSKGGAAEKQQAKALEKQQEQLYTELIQRGINAARCELGQLYAFTGREKEALRLLTEGAERGSLACMRSIYFYADQGMFQEVLPRNARTTWALKAAEKGLVSAYETLAWWYENGQQDSDLEKDVVEAYRWTWLAAERRMQPPEEAVQRFVPGMPPRRVEAARKLVKEWNAKHPPLR